MPPSDYSNIPSVLPEDLQRLAEEQLRQILAATPKLVFYDTVPVVPKWLYDLMAEMDDG